MGTTFLGIYDQSYETFARRFAAGAPEGRRQFFTKPQYSFPLCAGPRWWTGTRVHALGKRISGFAASF